MVTLAHDACALTHQGNVRDHNEDSCLDLSQEGLWVVADGMGGHDHGDFASQLIVEQLSSVRRRERPSEFVDAIEDLVLAVNQQLHDKSADGVIGSTVVAFVNFDRFGLTIWAGDSRAYFFRGGTLTQISRDHSEVQNLVDQGLVSAEEAESHPKANIITRAIGGGEQLYLDYELQEVEPGDRYLLCSDGLFKDLSDAEIAAELAQGSCSDVAASLLEKALSRTCSDNVTVLVIDFYLSSESGAADDELDTLTKPGSGSG